MAEYKAKLKTVEKWEKDLKVKLSKDLEGDFVTKAKCMLYTKHVDSIKHPKTFTQIWINGLKSVKKDSIQKHLNGEAHKKANKLEQKRQLGPMGFKEKVMKDTPKGRGLTKMGQKDLETLRICFNSEYYLVKQERSFSDYPNLITLQHKNSIKKFHSYVTERAAADFTDCIVKKEDLIKAISTSNNFPVLTEGSTDSAVIEEEVLYLLFLNEGKPEIKFFSIETPSHTTAEGLKEAISSALKRTRMTEFHTKLADFNVDDTSVNTGIHKVLAQLLHESSPCLNVVHCFNHRFELAIKDMLKATFFKDINTLLNKLYYLYRKNPKHLLELHKFSEAYEKSMPKPAKANGTRWISHKFTSRFFLKTMAYL